MKKEQTMGSLQLLIATLIWGSAFAAQRVGMDHIGPMTFQAARSLLAVAALTGFIFLVETDKGQYLPRWADKQLWKTGIADHESGIGCRSPLRLGNPSVWSLRASSCVRQKRSSKLEAAPNGAASSFCPISGLACPSIPQQSCAAENSRHRKGRCGQGIIRAARRTA